MEQQAALKRLTAIENEAAELRKIIEAPKKITDRIKSYEDACQYEGITSLQIYDFIKVPEQDRESSFAHHQLTVIARALNEGYKFNWDDSNEYKYYPWFDMRSGFGFSGSGCGGWCTGTFVGSRLCFKTEELAKYAGKQFEGIYKKLFIQ